MTYDLRLMTIIDTHAHLDHLPDAEEALKAAYAQHVSDIVAVGVDLAANQKNLELKKSVAHPRIHVALGIHPGNIKAEAVEETLQFIRKNIREAVAVGETGLDFWYKTVKKDEDKKREQREVFQRQLDIAKEFQLPIVIHSRGAWRDCLEMTKSAGIPKALFHWYSGPVDILKEILDAGFFVSCSPSLAYSPQSREAISFAPTERTLIETDTPVHYGKGEEGFQAEPKDVWRTLRAYCALKNLDEEMTLNILNQNAKSFFGIS